MELLLTGVGGVSFIYYLVTENSKKISLESSKSSKSSKSSEFPEFPEFSEFSESTEFTEHVDILKQRSMKGLDKDTRKVLDTILINKNTIPVGSFKYKVSRYPGDIDILEKVQGCCSKERSLEIIVKDLQNIGVKISKSNDIYLGDFKAGLDKRFYVELKKTYTSHEMNEFTEKLKTNGITLTETELKNMTVNSVNFYDIARQYFVLRWNLKELIDGYKISNGQKFMLKHAIEDDSPVKIDLWGKVNGNYTEITNYFLFKWKDKNNNTYDIGHTLNINTYTEELDLDIIKYSSKDHYKPLKVLKRLWNKSLYLKDTHTLNKIYKILYSDISLLNQINGESEVISSMVVKLKNPPFETLMKQIAGFKYRINNVIEINLDLIESKLYQIIDNIEPNADSILGGLYLISNILQEIINKETENYIKKTGIRVEI